MADEPDPDDVPNFNPRQFFEMLRKSASVKAGAIIFGEAQVAYYDTLKANGMSEQQAYNLLAHTTEQLIRAIATATPGVASVVFQAAEVRNVVNQMGGKEVPGSGE